MHLQMYQAIQRIEEDGRIEKFKLQLQYRNNGAETPKDWSIVTGLVDNDWLNIYGDTISILQSVTSKLDMFFIYTYLFTRIS